MVISNCEITKQNSEVLKDCVMLKTSSLYKEYGGYHTGMDIAGSDVYSLYDGTVVSVGRSGSRYSVIVQTGSSFCMCYANIISIPLVRKGQTVSAGDHLGKVRGYVHIEALSKTESLWPVRIGKEDWYKYDVSAVIYGGYIQTQNDQDLVLFSSMNIAEISDYPGGVTDTLTDASDYILSNNGGD